MSGTQVQVECEFNPATRNRIKEIAADIFQTDVGGIDLAMSPDDIERWDSLNHLRLITQIESEFSLRLTMQQIQNVKCLEDFVIFISERAP